MLASAPVSFFGGYSHVAVDDFGGNANVFSIGLRFYTGAGTLIERHRNGTLGSVGTPFSQTLYAGF